MVPEEMESRGGSVPDMVKKLIVTAGSGGYTSPYRRALGTDKYEYIAVPTAGAVSSIPWDDGNVAGVIFSGGADIDPSFYDETAESGTHCSSAHDALDAAVLEAIRGKPIKKMGTCRGAQLLWADSEKAKLYQHIPHHFGDHQATLVEVSYRRGDRRNQPDPSLDLPTTFNINSVHHQACRWDTWEPHNSGSRHPLLLQSGVSEGQTSVEAWCNPDRGNLGFQWHPEWVRPDSDAYYWFEAVVKQFFEPDVEGTDTRVPPHAGCWNSYRCDLTDEVRSVCQDARL